MKVKKSRIPELTAFMKERRGNRTTDHLNKLIGSTSYWRYEKIGYLPTEGKVLQRLANALGCTTEELKSYLPNHNPQSVLPLIKAIAATNCKELSRSELEFLISTQAKLKGSLTPGLVEELISFHRGPVDNASN